jgi:glycosyltransferase involved in cell wall biosynthesis
MRVAWLAYGDLGQPTGGYVYDRLVVAGLRAQGDAVDVLDPRVVVDVAACLANDVEVVVGDALCVPELGAIFEAAPAEAARVLLVHHFTSWEVERAAGSNDESRVAEARAVRASDRLIATGRATRARLGASHPDARVDVVVPGADRLASYGAPAAPAAPAATSGRIELLFVGSLVARKRLMLLLDALEELADGPLVLTIAGDPTREPTHAAELAARIEGSPRLRARVTLAGVVTDGELAKRMAGADALVLPSSLEGYGMVLTESLAAGLPVIAARAAAAAAGLREGDAVCVFDDRADLVVTLGRFAADATLRSAMRRATAALVLPRWDETIAAFRRVLVLARRRP